MFGWADVASFDHDPASHGTNGIEAVPSSGPNPVEPTADLARCFLRLANLPNFALDRLIPSLIDQNPWAHWRNPMDMIFQG